MHSKSEISHIDADVHGSCSKRMSESVTARVRAQYNELPYPPRTPDDERWRLKAHGYVYGLDRINDLCFNGRLDIEQGLRVLVAGGGTGDAVVSLGEQLRDTPSEIVYLDISEQALNIARARAKVRDIPNIQWELGSILDLSESKVEPLII